MLSTAEDTMDDLRTLLENERRLRKEAEGALETLRGQTARSSASTMGSMRSPMAMSLPDGGSPPPLGNGWRDTRKTTITVRSCVVCGRDDRPGEQRAKGFKCNMCIGLPSNPHFVKCFEDAKTLTKARSATGEFLVNEYLLECNLGQGSFGKVRLARHEPSNMLYAVKCLTKDALQQSMPNRHRRRGNPMKPVFDEINRMKELSHPNVIQIYGYMVSNDEVMIIMEYLSGGQIFDPAEGPVKVPTLKRYMVAIASGLDYLHDQGIIHRDIKPQNILLDKNGNVKLADFGVSAKIPDESESMKVWGCIGTPAYIPPEAFQSASMDGEPSDVWAFGVTMYQLGFGKLPWDEKLPLSTAIKEQEILFDHEDDSFNCILMKMLDRNPVTRITCQEIKRHQFVREVRIRKGHPVEPMSVNLKYDAEEKCVRIIDGSDGPGAAALQAFLESSGGVFTILPGGDYEVTLIDQGKDPRMKAKSQESEYSNSNDCNDRGLPCDIDAARKSVIIHEEWDEAELEEHMSTSPSPSPKTMHRSGYRSEQQITLGTEN